MTSSTTIEAVGTSGTLNGVTLDGTLEINGASAAVKNGIVLNGVIEVISSADPADNHSTLIFDDSNGPETLSTTSLGHIYFDATLGHLADTSSPGVFNSLNVVGSTLTIAAGVTINGSSGLNVPSSTDAITGLIDNLGSIDEDSGGTLAINFGQGSGSPVGWTNNGAIEVSNGKLELGGAWINNGVISASSNTILYLGDGVVAGAANPDPTGDAWVNNGTINTTGTLVYLGGFLTQGPTNYDPAALGLGTDTVYLIGTFKNALQTLALTPGVTSGSGTWMVSGGQIDGGTVDATAAPLVVSGGALEGVTLSGTLNVLGANATIKDGLVLDGVIELGEAFTLSPVLIFDDTDGPQMLSTTSNGFIDFASSGSLNVFGSTLTIAAGVTIQSDYPLPEPYFPAMDSITGPIDNFGKIKNDSGGIILINYDRGPGSLYTWQDSAGSLIPWTNNGSIEVRIGTLSLGGLLTNNGTITAGIGTTFNLGDSWVAPDPVDPNPTGDAWVNNGTITSGGTNVSLGGNLTWATTNLDLDALGLGKDTVSILGTLDNSSHTLTLTWGVTSVTGSWTLRPGQIDGGTVDERGAALIVESYGILNGVTLIGSPSSEPPSGPSGAPAQLHDPIQAMGPNGRYVDLLYERLLGRAADVQGGTNFVSALDSGQATKAEVVEVILHSQEYLTLEATLLYQGILGRSPDAGGLANSVAMLVAGASSTQLEATLLGSAEYYTNAGGTNAGFFSALYESVLGRKADSIGVQNFEQELAGGASRAMVAQQMLVSPEGVLPEVRSIYESVLNRAADGAGISDFGALLLNGGSPEQIIVQLASSPEFAGLVNGDIGQVFVTQVYQALLGRAPDPAALASDAGAIDAGTMTRLQIVEEIESSTEYRTNEVDNLYQQVLERARTRAVWPALSLFCNKAARFLSWRQSCSPPMSSSLPRAAAPTADSSAPSTRSP